MKALFFYLLPFFTFVWEGNNPPTANPREQVLLDQSISSCVSSTPQRKVLAAISCISSGPWGSPSTWSSGTVPTVSDDISIPKDFTVTLSGAATARSIVIAGNLKPATVSSNFDLTTQGILIDAGGVLQIGTATTPYIGKGSITLTGSSSSDVLFSTMPIMGTKVIGVMSGGRLDLFGQSRKSWTQLNVTAAANASSITLKEAVDWQVNDEIVIASTDFNPNQAEKRKITAIQGSVLTLDSPLSYMHWGAVQNYANATRSFVLDERAEVGLLTHNLKIQGDASSTTNGFGGHIMSMAGSVASASNVELFQMGQKSKVGRYPWHWHLVGNASGQFIKNSSIHQSFNRVITVHGTNNTVVEGNVGYDFTGHGFFLENGDETGNLFKNNLGVLCKRPAVGEQTTPTDIGLGSNVDSDAMPSIFWISNPANDFIGNVAAGSAGSGFWHLALAKPLGTANTQMTPFNMPMGVFDDNKGHSSNFNWGIDGSVDTSTGLFQGGRYMPESNGKQSIPQVNRFTGYKSLDRNIWFRANTMEFYDCALADNSRATFFAYNQILYNSLIVGKSSNIGTPTSASELQAGRSLPYPSLSINDGSNAFRGHSIYDGPSGIVNTHFAGFNNVGAKAYCFQTNGAARKSTNHFARGITFDADTFEANKVNFSPAAYRSYMYISGLIDEDGSITGKPNTRITPIITAPNKHVYEEGLNVPQTNKIKRADWGAWLTGNTDFLYLRLDDKWDTGDGPTMPMYQIAKYPDGSTHAVYQNKTLNLYFDAPLIVNDTGYVYYFQYHKFPNHIDNINMGFGKNNTDGVIIALPNVKSNINVSGGASLASSLANLKTSTTSKYLIKDNTLFLKLVTTIAISDAARWQFGSNYPFTTNQIQVCQNSNCGDATGFTEQVTLLDYGLGDDSRDAISTTDNLTKPTITTNVGSASFTVRNNGNGQDGYTDYSLNFTRQVWEAYKTLGIDYTGPKVEVLAKSTAAEYISLGTYDSADISKIKLGNPADYGVLSKINGLILRFRESNMGGTLNSASSSAVTLRSIKLGYSEPASYSVSLTPTTNTDTDGDGMTDISESQACRNATNATDFGINFDSQADSANTWEIRNIANFSVNSGKASGLSSTNDANFFKMGTYGFSGSSISKLRLNLKASANTTAQIFWENEDGSFSQARSSSVAYTGNGAWQVLEFNVAANTNWTGKTIKSLRIDPVNTANVNFEIDWLRAENYAECPCEPQAVAVAVATTDGWTYYAVSPTTDYLFAIEHTPQGGNTQAFTASISINKLCGSDISVYSLTDTSQKEGTFVSGLYWNITLSSGSTNGFVNIRYFPDANQNNALINTANQFYTTSGANYSSPLIYFKTNKTLTLPADLRTDARGIKDGVWPLLTSSIGNISGKDYVQFNEVSNIQNSGGSGLKRITNLTQNSEVTKIPVGGLRFNSTLRKFEGFDGTSWKGVN